MLADATRITADIDWALANPGDEATNTLSCYAILDVGSSHVYRKKDIDWIRGASFLLTDQKKKWGHVAFMDTTTLTNAVQILDPEIEMAECPAGKIIDLATFVQAAIFEDHIMHLETSYDLSGRARSLFNDLVPIQSIKWMHVPDLRELFNHLWTNAESTSAQLFTYPELAQKFSVWWTSVLGYKIALEDVASPATDYRKYFSSIETSAIIHAIDGIDKYYSNLVQEAYSNFGLVRIYIVESCLRAIFNYVVANALQATYYASAYRTYLKKLIQEEFDQSTPRYLKSLSNLLEEQHEFALTQEAVSFARQPVPLCLSAALSKTSTLNDVVNKIGELRAAAEPLRKKRRELDEALRVGNLPVFGRLCKAISDDAAALSRSEYFLGHSQLGRLAVSIGGARPFFGALGHLLVSFSKLPDEIKNVLRARFVRPELWAIAQLGSEARQALDGTEHLYSLLASKGFRISHLERETNREILSRLSG